MKLQSKINLILGLIFLLSLVGVGLISYISEIRQAEKNVMRYADILMEIPVATRKYTASEVLPLLRSNMDTKFYPQSVPAYAATQIFNIVSKKFPDYSFRSATLNPINLKNLANPWETSIIKEFRNNPKQNKISGKYIKNSEDFMFLASPIIVKKETCLLCHGDPNDAPTSVINQYGSKNGFGWKLNEIIGAHIVLVPTLLAFEHVYQTIRHQLLSLASVFILIYIAINIMIYLLIIQPINRVSKVTDEVSRGKRNVEQFKHSNKDEIGMLEQAFNRLSRSVYKAIQLIRKNDK